MPLRVGGTVLTLIPFISSAVALLFQVLQQ
jgi:hypothetical protein